MDLKGSWNLFKSAGSNFSADSATTQGAALAFYTALSLGPLLVILLTVVGFTGKHAQQEMINQVQSLVGSQAGEAVTMIIQGASQKKGHGIVGSIIGGLVLLFSATSLFAQLQTSLNKIWKVEAKPGQGIWGWLRSRVFSAAAILGIGFLLLVSLVLSAGLSLIFSGNAVIWQIVNQVASFVVATLLFTLIYKILPDVNIAWRDAVIGAVFTAVLFIIGKSVIGAYLGYSATGSAYGAAGSLIVLLLWVYYSSLILFFGAELTQAYSRQYGSVITPDEYAQPRGGHKEEFERKTGGKAKPEQAQKKQEEKHAPDRLRWQPEPAKSGNGHEHQPAAPAHAEPTPALGDLRLGEVLLMALVLVASIFLRKQQKSPSPQPTKK